MDAFVIPTTAVKDLYLLCKFSLLLHVTYCTWKSFLAQVAVSYAMVASILFISKLRVSVFL